ncbi:hypothetical protein [Parahaliea mediterranea]|nr:hypothetical protein [Parahaliea mediterranea]
MKIPQHWGKRAIIPYLPPACNADMTAAASRLSRDAIDSQTNGY